MILSRYNYELNVGDRTYVYNLLTRSLIDVDTISYEKLKEKLHKGEQLDDGLINEFYKLGIIVNSYNNEVIRSQLLFNKMKYSEELLNLFVGITNKCNLKCAYCYQDTGTRLLEDNIMSEDSWKQIYNAIIYKKENTALKSISISLFGGEPLLDLRLVERIIFDLDKLRDEDFFVYISMITNGVNLTERFVDNISERINNIQITFDGPKELHDKYRVFKNGNGSFEKIYRNLLLYREKLKGKISLRINISNLEDIFKVKTFLSNMVKDEMEKYISGIGFQKVFEGQSEIEYKGCSEIKTKEAEDIISMLYLEAASLGYHITKTFIEGPCLANHINSMAIDDRLNIYKCPGVLFKVDEIVGRVENKRFNILDDKYYENIVYQDACMSDCKYMPICYGGCLWKKNRSNKCNKEDFDSTIRMRLEAYIKSNYCNI